MKKQSLPEKQLTKEQIIALKQEKKKTQEELDELQGKTAGGKLCIRCISSCDMKPKAAAQVFDNMMSDQSDLVVKILSNMTADQRAAILSNMSVANASQITVLMEQ